jgi:energy-coupling factor transport system permease protein
VKVFEGLKFKRVDSPIHRLDPRVKFVVSCVIFLLVLLFTELTALVFLLFAQIPLILLARIQREWARSIRGSLVLISLIFFTNLIVGFFSNSYQLTSEVLTFSASMATRFIALMSSFSIFFLTTSPDDLSMALQESHVPYEFSFAFTTAVRFVPVLANEAQTIIDAQRSRGLELERGNILKRVKNYVPILIPLIVGAIRRSLELAEAMESRAFGAKKARTTLYVLRIGLRDYAALLMAMTVLAFAVYIRYTVPIPNISIPLP